MFPILLSFLLTFSAFGPQTGLSDTLLVGEEAVVYENATSKFVTVTVYFGTTGPGGKAIARHYEVKQLLQSKETLRRIKAVTFEVEQGGTIVVQCQRVTNNYCKCPYRVEVNGISNPPSRTPDRIEGFDK